MSRAVPVPPAERELRAILRNIGFCYFLSGGLGLVYQILWLRRLLLVFGSTVHAVSTVLTVFFAGLALGSWLFGRLIDRREQAGLRWYAVLEVGVGLYAFATLPLFQAIEGLYLPIYRASGFSPAVLVVASFVCSTLILLLPATLLGATFPVISRFLVRSSEGRGARLADLYALNTAGAMMGTLGVYYVALPMLGLSRTLLCAGVLNLGIGGLCLVFDRHLESLGFRTPAAGPTLAAPASAEPLPAPLRWLLVAFGLSGFSAMVYEVAWTRVLSLVLGSSIYAFCLLLATFLGGMALGSFVVRRDLRRQPATLGRVVRLEVLLALYGLASIALLSQLPDCFVALWPLWGQSFAALSWLQVFISALVMLLPTVLMGALFPIVSDLVTQQFARFGQRLGSAYAINTLGGILGSFLAGFVLIPWLGLPWAIVIAALVNGLAAALVFIGSDRQRRLPRIAVSGACLAGLALGGVLIVPTWQRQVLTAGVYLNPTAYRGGSVQQSVAGSTLLYYRDSLNATVSVHQEGETIFLKVGGKTDASNGLDMGTQALSAHLPLLLHRGQAKRALVIGLGSGVTLGHAGRYPLTTLDCAELDPAVIDAARLFKAYNYGIHDDPRVRIFAADGRNFLLANQAPYDVIISEPSNPWMAGLAYLFTQEFYQLAKRQLAPGGVMCQWVQLYRLFPGDLKLMLRTFRQEFPYVTVWSSIPGDLLLIGSEQPLTLDAATLARRMAQPTVQESLRAVAVEHMDALLQLFLFGSRELEQLTLDTPWLHQDDQPWLEFNAPKALYFGPSLDLNYDGLRQFQADPRAVVRDYAPSADAGAAASVTRLWMSRQEYRRARDQVARALQQFPDDAALWRLAGEARLQGSELLTAEAAFRRAVDLAPRDPAAYRSLGRLNLRQRRLPEAQQWYLRAAALQPPDALTAGEMGDSWRLNGEFRWAAEWYRSAIAQRQTPSRKLWLAYAETLKELRDWPAAGEAAQRGARAFPREAAFAVLAGTAWLEQGRAEEAAAWFQQALKVAPNAVESYYGLARIASAQGRTAQAIRFLSQGLRYQPYHRASLELWNRLIQQP